MGGNVPEWADYDTAQPQIVLETRRVQHRHLLAICGDRKSATEMSELKVNYGSLNRFIL